MFGLTEKAQNSEKLRDIIFPICGTNILQELLTAEPEKRVWDGTITSGSALIGEQ